MQVPLGKLTSYLLGIVASLALFSVILLGFGYNPISSMVGLATGSFGTTLLSQSYLQLACKGSANEDVYLFVESLYTGSREELARALGRLLKYGATSGTDIATGATIGTAMAAGGEVMSG